MRHDRPRQRLVNGQAQRRVAWVLAQRDRRQLVQPMLPAGLFDQAVPRIIHTRRPRNVSGVEAGFVRQTFGALPVGIEFCQNCR